MRKLLNFRDANIRARLQRRKDKDLIYIYPTVGNSGTSFETPGRWQLSTVQQDDYRRKRANTNKTESTTEHDEQT